MTRRGDHPFGRRSIATHADLTAALKAKGGGRGVFYTAGLPVTAKGFCDQLNRMQEAERVLDLAFAAGQFDHIVNEVRGMARLDFVAAMEQEARDVLVGAEFADIRALWRGGYASSSKGLMALQATAGHAPDKRWTCVAQGVDTDATGMKSVVADPAELMRRRMAPGRGVPE